MDFNADLSDFTNQCRLFPLPDVPLFPHALVPLHIFEPRYRQMTEDALASDRLVTMVQIRPATESVPWEEPVPIVGVGCVGRIVQHERLPDGRFNFLLLGCARVRLTKEIPSDRLYRLAEAEIMEDQDTDQSFDPLRREFIYLFRRVFETRQRIDDNLENLITSCIPLGVLTDIIAHALGLPVETKQQLLAEPNVARRVTLVFSILRQLVDGGDPARVYPPLFSPN